MGNGGDEKVEVRVERVERAGRSYEEVGKHEEAIEEEG